MPSVLLVDAERISRLGAARRKDRLIKQQLLCLLNWSNLKLFLMEIIGVTCPIEISVT
jgi:hypothetical protein